MLTERYLAIMLEILAEGYPHSCVSAHLAGRDKPDASKARLVMAELTQAGRIKLF
jgi:hypothetical protein